MIQNFFNQYDTRGRKHLEFFKPNKLFLQIIYRGAYSLSSIGSFVIYKRVLLLPAPGKSQLVDYGLTFVNWSRRQIHHRVLRAWQMDSVNDGDG